MHAAQPHLELQALCGEGSVLLVKGFSLLGQVEHGILQRPMLIHLHRVIQQEWKYMRAGA